MTKVQLTVHRSTQSIGGNCIEISTSNGGRLLLDMGRPLDAPKEAKNLLPESLCKEGALDGVLISHPHQDHYGLLDEAPEHWQVYCGEATGKLMNLTLGIFGKSINNPLTHWQSGKSIEIGPFTVTPYLTDHSAFDAYMLQIDVAGKRLFYSGDFRLHGRKSALVERLMQNPPKDIDVLLMEGTNLGSDKACVTETELEKDYIQLFKKTEGRVFVSWSAQNIDRTVTLFRACKQTGRTLVVDLYTADVMELLASYGKLPAPDWEGIKVVITSAMAKMYKRTGREEFVKRMVKYGIAANKLNETPEKWVVMIRPSLIKDYQFKEVTPNASDAWSWGQWQGYLHEGDGLKIKHWFEQSNTPATHIHTSGHASQTDLQAFAKNINAKAFVPIHGVKWDEAEGFGNVKRLVDGELFVV
jgi:ribonuclease J